MLPARHAIHAAANPLPSPCHHVSNWKSDSQPRVWSPTRRYRTRRCSMLRPTPNASIDTERVAAECVRWFYHARARYILPSPRLVITYQHGRAILSREHGRQRVATEHVGAPAQRLLLSTVIHVGFPLIRMRGNFLFQKTTPPPTPTTQTHTLSLHTPTTPRGNFLTTSETAKLKLC